MAYSWPLRGRGSMCRNKYCEEYARKRMKQRTAGTARELREKVSIQSVVRLRQMIITVESCT